MDSMDQRPKLQLISKAISPPFRDGSKCLVRDLCQHLTKVRPEVLGTRDRAPELASHIVSHPVYGANSGFSPALRQNLQVAAFLLLSRRADLWHFVFAPNPRSSQVARVLKTLRRVPTLQTVASPPRDFKNPQSLLFGDVVVAQSAWTRAMFEKSYVAEGALCPRIEVIAPPAPFVETPSEEAVREARAIFGAAEGQPLFLYPGDLEVSRGAERIVEWSRALVEKIPGARIAIAYRNKTSNAQERAVELAEKADPRILSFVCNVPDIHALVVASTAVLFPVDDLYGKVDLPIVLLESFRLGTPVVALNEGPLASLQGALLLPDVQEEWVAAAAKLTREGHFRERWRERGFLALRENYEPQMIAAQYESLYRDLLRGH